LQINQKVSNQFLTCEQLASRWNKPVKWIHSNWRALDLPVMRLGQQLRFSSEQIEKWEQAHSDEGPATNK
jgi:hypothetical protein